MGRPREQNVSKDALWKRAQRSGTRASHCSRCGKALSGKDGVQHHSEGVMTNEHKRKSLCRSCHTTIDNPMKDAIKERLNA